jgi:hypothetical protein
MMTQPEPSVSSNGLEDQVGLEGEEVREVASQLGLIRKRHDEAKESNIKKKALLERIKSEIESLESFKETTETESLSVQHKFEQLTMTLESIKVKYDEELLQRRMYEQMLDRMKATKVALDVKANKVISHLKSARKVMETEKEKARRMKESKYQSQILLSEFKEVTDFEQRKRDERVAQLEKNLKMRQEAALRREERKVRQAEIAEAAASEQNEAVEVRCKDTLLLHRLWYRNLQYKLDSERDNSAEIVRAFQQIKMVTGLNDVREITDGFVNREQKYQMLLDAVAESELKLDELRLESLAARDRLKDLQLAEMGSRGLQSDVMTLEHKIGVVSKESLGVKERLQKSALVYDSVLGWTKKIMRKLELNPEELEVLGGMRINESPYRLYDLFAKILSKTKELSGTLATEISHTRQEMEVLAGKHTDQIVVSTRQQEISTPEFVAKNVRVRPKEVQAVTEEEEEDISQLIEQRRQMKRDWKEKGEQARRRKQGSN